jgi:hypothetical protein
MTIHGGRLAWGWRFGVSVGSYGTQAMLVLRVYVLFWWVEVTL